ncbi:hypothetical protein VTN77DRAFT_599 [Rasamsonia byssochlamydoides]|uniref:uncharacterized protein n=1 Tax=Rasamsonia byssochlamydoides TaxID=89139 RepID=UPI0037435493
MSRGSMAGSGRKIKDFGLTEVYTSPEKPPQIDIVFVHGLNGHPKDTWTSKNGVFWPADLLPSFLESQRVRILTYGYNADVTSFTDGTSKDHIHHHAETLAADLVANRGLRNALERPIIFVCHSLGGIVVKRAIVTSYNMEDEKQKHLRSLYVSTYGILFMGTPHNGSEAAKWALLLQKICSAVFPRKFLDTSPQLIEALKTRNETLQNINRLFNDHISRFHVFFFHETKPLDLKGTREFIVDEESAAPDVGGVERMGIEGDHSSMCKFEDENAPAFEAVAEAIVRYSREAPALIAGRWVEEKQHRKLQSRQKAQEIVSSTADVSTAGDALDKENMDRMGGSVVSLPAPRRSSAENSPPQRMVQTVAALPSSRPSLFVVPPGFHPNATFYGMQKELEELHARLFKEKRKERLVAVLICGGPGSGKTHLAREYVHRYRKDFPGGIFWVDAKSFQSASKCFWDIAQAAALTDGKESTIAATYVDDVRNWLQKREEWLLVFDGLSFIDDRGIDTFRQFLPFSKKSGIIYTSVDRTLCKKQRLFEPYCLTVQPLQVEDARRILFKDLGIKKPTLEQMNKATELVKHYHGLPLAIHAIGHRLRATGKPIEKYHIHSHFTDYKLAEPFLSTMHDLYRREHFEALNLINMLAFFGHHVPVGLITLGRSALAPFNVQILASSRPGERRDLDTTLGVLIRYGLIERVSDLYPMNQEAATSLDGNDKKSADLPLVLSSDSFTTDNSQDTIASVYQSTIDVIKIHSVVQGFCRDELRSMDKEKSEADSHSNDGRALTGKQAAGYYDSWLTVATHLFCRSYENAKNRMDRLPGSGFVKDYREYETHAERLVELFPKKLHNHPQIVRDAWESLKEAIKSIKKSINRLSPNASEESLRHEKSIFDLSSSSSSDPSSSAEEGPSRSSTWSPDSTEALAIELPQNIVPSQHREHVHLELFPPHMYRYRVPGDEKDDGYLTDGESVKASSTRRSSLTASQTTEKPRSGQNGNDESGWQLVKRSRKTKVSTTEKRTRFRGRAKNRNLGEYRPVHALARVSSVQGRGSPSRTSDETSKTPTTTAKTLLAAVHNSSPAASAVRSSDRQKENQRTWASVAAAISAPSSKKGSVSSGKLRIRTESSRETLSSRSSNVQPSPLSGEFKRNLLGVLTRSEPGLVPGHHLRAGDANSALSAPGSRYHSRHPSAVLSLDPSRSSMPNQLAEMTIDDLTYNERAMVTSQRRFRSPQRSPAQVPHTMMQGQGISPPAHPSAIMPGSSPPAFPTGYMSEPLSAPMSRDPSWQSYDSWHTEPVPYSSSISHPPGMPGYGYQPTSVNTFVQITTVPPQPHPQHLEPSVSSSSYVVRGRASPSAAEGMTASASAWTRFEYGGEPEVMLFGEHEVDIGRARQRVRDWEQRRQLQAPMPRRAPRVIPQMEFWGRDVHSTFVQMQQENPTGRLRGDPPSSSRSEYPGLGLRFGQDPEH